VSREDIVAVVSRLFAIALFLAGLKFAVTAASFYAASEQVAGLALMLAMVATMVAIAALLWYFPLTIARKLLPVMKEPKPASVVDGPTLFSLALMILGVWFLANAVIDLGYWGMFLSRIWGSVPDDFGLTVEQKGGLLSTALELVVALVLLFGSSGIRNLLFKIRYGSSLPNDPPVDESSSQA